MVAGALLVSWKTADPTLSRLLAVATALLLAGSFTLTFWHSARSRLLALVADIVLAAWPSTLLNPVGTLTVLAAALVAWLQVKRYPETAHSYAVAATELGAIAVEARYVASQSELATFAATAESAISREHSMWLARHGNRFGH